MTSLKYFIAAFVILLTCNVQAKSPIEFDEVSKQAGIEDQGIDGAGIAFWDYDEDGDVDVYINNSDGNNSHLGLRNRLYENDGTGHFRDVAEERACSTATVRDEAFHGAIMTMTGILISFSAT